MDSLQLFLKYRTGEFIRVIRSLIIKTVLDLNYDLRGGVDDSHSKNPPNGRTKKLPAQGLGSFQLNVMK